jgi:DNA-binding transcriptional ArsR family regulator
MKEQFKETAALIAEPVRATILWTLLDGRAFTATELAIAADTSASNISMHLAKLVRGGLLKVESQGRHRYYALSGPETAYAMEALALLGVPAAQGVPASQGAPASQGSPRSLASQGARASPGSPAAQYPSPIKQCRTCYDHLAGKTGVAIADALLQQRMMTNIDGCFGLTAKGKRWFGELGINVDELASLRRCFLRPCLDWSERRYHIAGSLAAALLDKMLQADWIRRTRNSRAVVVTGKGQKELYAGLKVVV